MMTIGVFTGMSLSCRRSRPLPGNEDMRETARRAGAEPWWIGPPAL
jgi:hypothetical protein